MADRAVEARIPDEPLLIALPKNCGCSVIWISRNTVKFAADESGPSRRKMDKNKSMATARNPAIE